MAATEPGVGAAPAPGASPSNAVSTPGAGRACLAAALLLPGVMGAGPAAAQSEVEPAPPSLAFKWLDYQDWQPGLKRIGVRAPSLAATLPVGTRWQVDASGTQDTVSGASPRWHSGISGASRMQDRREAGDVQVTRFFDRARVTAGWAGSTENDFRSQAFSLQARLSSDDLNTTWNLGLAVTRDRIGSSDDPDLDARRRTVEATLGVTQAMSRRDLVQLSLTLADGRGFYDDPYKRIDRRPDERRQVIGTWRWHHHLDGTDLTLRLHWRGYRDSFGVRSHTLGFEPAWRPSTRWRLTPSVRYYTQTAASFYYDPVYSVAGAPFPPGWFEQPPRHLSPDHRLAALGAWTVGLKLDWQPAPGWWLDLKVEHYAQRAAWRVGGAGSPGLAPFRARFVQWGLARKF